MPSNPRKNKGVYLELPPELVEQMKAFAQKRGQGFKDAVAEAMRRHLTYPPPMPEVAPLPDVPAPQAGSDPEPKPQPKPEPKKRKGK